ncbi:hypothetical protein ACFQ0X_00920 [Streptomyces rectiviolaceus]|uniref:Integral membrane protein n=1 Tax=Streptomyces rectiviolaceus TaxID=332591 RepID=A0ABP6M6V9_9ACTN
MVEQHDKQAPVSDSASAPRGRRNYASCLATMVVVIAFLTVPAFGKELWGRDVWRWAGASWPGGVYSLAVTLGLAVPCLLLLVFAALTSVNWQRFKARSCAWTATACFGLIALLAMGGAVAETWPFGGGRRGSPGGTETSRHYPALWAAGGGATLLGFLVLAVVIRRREKQRLSRS